MKGALWIPAVGLLGLAVLLGGGCGGMRPPPGATVEERDLLTTGYCKCGTCCGWRRNRWGMPVYAYGPLEGRRKQIGITASGTRARVGTLAADTSRYPFGTVMHIPGYGYGVVEDRGGAIRGDHIDLYFDSHEEARQWGRRRLRVRIWRRPPG
jgi:3D (Asp-Asp-Asp) domain-containing protein